MLAVKPSASSLSGNIAQREYWPTRSAKLGFVVLLRPNRLDWTLLTTARKMPMSTTRRKKSIRKKKNAPPRVLSVSAMK